ncbi:MAG: hypothetical protein R3B70_23285 [Polyangiaceae bacterium]
MNTSAGSEDVDGGGAEAGARGEEKGGETELEMLDRAQKALSGRPGEALSIAEEHGRRFPKGGLAPEREVIAIQALAALGRREEARGRAERFRAAHPGSAYLRRIDVLLGK